MKIPPADTFGQTLSKLFTPEHAAQTRALQAELDRLKSLADGWSPRKLHADLKNAQARARNSPGEDAVAQLAVAMDETDGHDTHLNPAQNRQWKQLRMAARLAGWQFYRRECKPFLLSIFDLVIGAIEDEAEAQKVRETEWLAEFEKWQVWATYYKRPQVPPSVAHAITRMALDVRQQRVLTEERTCDTRGLPDPTRLAATIRGIGLTVPALEISPSVPLPADVVSGGHGDGFAGINLGWHWRALGVERGKSLDNCPGFLVGPRGFIRSPRRDQASRLALQFVQCLPTTHSAFSG